MNTSKKIISLLMCMLMVLSIVPIIPGAMTAHAESSEALTYKISVGGGTADKTEAKAGEVITITATTPSNCRFCGWLTSDVELTDVNATTTTFVMPAKNVSVKANNLPVFVVYVNSCSADKTSAIAKETVTVTANAPTDGMKFIGWTSENDDTYTEVKFADVRATTTTFTMPAGRVKVIANYEPIGDTSYVVTVINGTSSKYIAKAGEEITIKADEKYRKQFTGWTANGIEIPDPTNATVTFVMPTNDVQVEANYVDAYLISVTNGSADKKQAGKDEIITITAKEPDEGTQFAGWTSTSGVVFEDASALTTTFVMLEKDVTVKANYEGIPVNPSYKISVGGGTADKTEAKAGEVVTITATTPTNCRFCGWLTSDVELTDVNATTTTFVMPAKNVSVKANNLPVFIVSVNSGSADKTSAIAKETITVTANAPADGMEFVEWTTEDGVVFADSKATTTTFTMPAYSVHIVATYCAHTYDSACDATCNKCQTVRTPSAHTYIAETTKKATTSADGVITYKCSACGDVESTETIAKIKSVTLSTTNYIYNGKNKTPKVTVKDANGKTLVKNTDYKLTVASKRSGIGRYTVKVTFIGNYSGTKNVYFYIKTGKPATVKSASQTTSSVKLSWSAVPGAAGYTVYRYSPSKKAYVKAGTTEGTSLTVSKLYAGTKYTFRVVSYGKTSAGKVYDSDVYALLKTATKTKTPELTKVTASSTKGKAYVYHSNVSGETGYTVYYSTKKDSGFKKYANFKADTTRCDITGLTSGKTYYFKVRTYIKTDSGYVYSAWSAVKSVKVK